MKKAIVIALVAGLLGGAMVAPADAKKKKPKPLTFELRYENPTFGVSIGPIWGGLCSGCPSFSTTEALTYATVEIIDDVSPTGHALFAWDTDGDGVYDTGETVCGKTEAPLALPASTQIGIFPFANPSIECQGSSLAGTVKVTLSATP